MNGGTFQKTVSSKTTYVIDLSENGSSSSKIQKAIKMNIKVISLNDFNELMHQYTFNVYIVQLLKQKGVFCENKFRD